MGVVTLTSTQIANRDAVPAVINDGRLSKGALRSAYDSVTAGSADSIASIYTMVSVPTTAMVRAVLLSCGAVTSAAADIGVYRTTADGGAVVSVALFGSAVSLASALTNSDVTNESASYTIAKRKQPLWQAAGLTSDPGGHLDICLTLTAAATASADVGLLVEFVDNGN